ncbi:nucleotidyl transferase AbiEii/AbiGii toxin family protein [Sinomonas sp. JGH33]|uniref:Nucleotidyl transferase AbiEii/AbiGii toxin family protein n=1 Tax=Sinomonas terricola TaxID=3110330 RepID=A0ABU5TDZ5_9MICC|nr:nucleotidyl transferase AbiEii/AbiGii toxin family protein [Sinomonas sp. JGH33]MEA5457311.1 nucleotidyl transferase AbiEii/AbiGii toxin family protein [Sinomonas sp. JGH33]
MSEGYKSWSAIAAAIKAKAQQDLAQGRTRHGVHEQLVQARFDRFLSRVFADGGDGWILKGGTAMLARVADSRSTKDLDLSAPGELDTAMRDLADRVSADLGDHIRFELVKTVNTGLGTNQPGTALRKAVFAAVDADTGKKLGDVSVDLALTHPPVGQPELKDPANRIHLPKDLTAFPYRLWPIADHVADKVCATLGTFGGAPSSRIKDLVDLVTIATTQQLDARELQKAIDARRILNNINSDLAVFKVPDAWREQSGRREYQRLARTAAVDGIDDVRDAEALVAGLVDPALASEPAPDGVTWVPRRGWQAQPPEHPDAAAEPGRGEVWVRAHVRAGWPVREHTRSARGTHT